MRVARRIFLGVIALALIAVAAVAILVHGRHATLVVSRAQPLTATANVSPQSFLFGSAVHVRVRAIVDRRAFDPDRLVLSAQWTPYSPVTPMTRERKDVGHFTTLVWSVDVHCVVVTCVPQQGSSERNWGGPSMAVCLTRPEMPMVTFTLILPWVRLLSRSSARW